MPELEPEVRKALKDSIKEKGIILPILVEMITEDTYDIIDGRNRFDICQELGAKEIECLISDPRDPYSTVLMYDLEICRRPLTTDQWKRYHAQRDAYVKECGERKFKQISNNIIPELRDMARKLFEANTDSDTLASLFILSNSPAKYQKMFVIETAGRTNVSELKTKIAEYQSKIIVLKNTAKEKAELQKQLELLQSGFKKQIEDKLRQKEAEIEKKYKDVAPGKLAEMLDAEKKKIRQQFESDLEELRTDLVDATAAKVEVQNKLDEVNENLKTTKRESEEAQKLASKYHQESENLHKAVQQLSSPDSLLKKLDAILSDTKAVAQKIDALQADTLAVCKGILAAKGSLNGTKATVQTKIYEITELIGELQFGKVTSTLAETINRIK
jgi:DNA repair exonuclease SbcCD ATPase subunit